MLREMYATREAVPLVGLSATGAAGNHRPRCSRPLRPSVGCDWELGVLGTGSSSSLLSLDGRAREET